MNKDYYLNQSLLQEKIIKRNAEARDADAAKDYTKALAIYREVVGDLRLAIHTYKAVVNAPTYIPLLAACENRIRELELLLAPPVPSGATAGGADNGAQLDALFNAPRPSVQWDDIAGLRKAKADLITAVVLPLRQPQLFENRAPPTGPLNPHNCRGNND